jgi:hypothetical protein
MKIRGIALAFMLGLGTASVAQEFVTADLVVFYTFDKATIKGETLTDTFGKSDGKIFGNVKSTAGVIGEAGDFDGNQSYVQIPDLGDWEQASIECWVQERAFSGIQGIVSTWQWAAGKVHFKFESNQIQAHKNDGVKIVFAAEEKKWFHVIYTADTKANELKLYVNGELKAEGIAGATPQNMRERRIGSEHDGRFLNGMVDEVRIYKRILTPKEVAQNHAATSNTLAVSPSGKLAASWASLKIR